MSRSPCYEFDDPARAIIIQNPATPAPWINYLSNGSMHAFVSQAGGGFCWWRNPVVYRLTRYRHHHLPIDSPGYCLYIKERGQPAWSPAWRPTQTPVSNWSARHLPGKTRFSASRNGLEATLTLFIAPGSDTLVWSLTLRNRSRQAKNLDLFAYAELSQFLWRPEQFFGYYVKYMLDVRFDPALGALLYMDRHQDNPELDTIPLVYFASTLPVASHSGDRDRFCGAYRDEGDPLAVEQGRCGNEPLDCGEPCAALHHALTLRPGQTRTVSFFLGAEAGGLTRYAACRRTIARRLAALRRPGAVARQEQELDTWWSRHFSALQCAIPDPAAARMINTWTPVNSVQSGRYSRSVNAAAPGIRGVGFRDSCQDMLAIAYRDPQWATRTFTYLLSQQYPDGHVVHASFPGETEKPWTSIHSDDHLWLPLLAHAIVAETGDTALLNQPVAFLGTDHVSPEGSGTIWAHLMRTSAFTEAHLGRHGIPLTLRSDWNDIIGKFALKGRGESVFAGMQYVYALRLLLALARATRRKRDAATLEARLARQIAALQRCAWDGGWWRRGFDDEGQPFGTRSSTFGQLYLNPQSWAVLAGIGTPRQQRQALDEVSAKLDTGIGLKKITPGFKTYPEEKNPFSGYGPGTSENGAIFCHANTWAIMAEALLGNASRAWRYFTQLIPHNIISRLGVERYRSEPYAWLSNIVGPESPQFGWGSVAHVTGTSAWMDVAATQYLLGIRPALDGLVIAPCVPAQWPGFKATRLFRTCRIELDFRADATLERGTVRLQIGRERLAGNMIPAARVAGTRRLAVSVRYAPCETPGA